MNYLPYFPTIYVPEFGQREYGQKRELSTANRIRVNL